MNKLTICSIQKIASQMLIIGFLMTFFSIMSTAQSLVQIKDITKVYYGDLNEWGGNPDKAKGTIKNNFGSDPAGYYWTQKEGWGASEKITHWTEISRDDMAIYLRSYNNSNGNTLKIDVYNNNVVIISGGEISSEPGKLLRTENELRKLTSEENALINQQENQANRAYTLTKPIGDKDLAKVMEWIGKETSRRSVGFCWKDTYARTNYNSQKECEDSEKGACEKLLSWWYVKCDNGYETSTVPNCLMKCPTAYLVGAGAQNVKVDCGLICATNSDKCAEGISEMVFAPVFMALNIVSFGLTGAAKNAAKNAVVKGVAAGTNAGVTKTALATNWTKLLDAIEASEKIVQPAIDAKDQFEYLLANVENLATEIERWNRSFELNFREYTSGSIELIINRRFPDPDDRAYIKRAYGQYQLTAMLDADKWRIAKSVLNAASIEPTGIVATINAFAHPVCDLKATPFPDVRIFPKSERYKVYPKVKFHHQNSMTLAQAQNMAKSNSWKLANEAEVTNAWTVGQLDRFAYGRLSNGKFAVPVQSDHPNFKKGTNIVAGGGNQGFFYILSNDLSVTTPTTASTNIAKGKPAKQSSDYSAGPGKTFPAGLAVDGVKEGFGKLSHTLQENGAWWEIDLERNYNISSIKVYNATDYPQRMNDFTILVSETPFNANTGGTAFVTNQSAPTPTQSYSGNATGRYVRLFLNGINYLTIHEIEIFGTPTPPAAGPITPVGDGMVRIQNSWYKKNYIHNQNGKIQQGPIESNWWSAQWKIIPAHSGWVRIQNRWYPDQYLHNQNGKLEVGKIQNNWASAMWKLVPAHSGWVRIQNSWYKDHYIHNQNGKIELGPIQNNWASAMWKTE